MRTLNINPENLERSAEEEEQVGQEIQEMQGLQQILNPQQGGGENGGLSAAGGGDSTAASINQETNPRTGLVPNS